MRWLIPGAKPPFERLDPGEAQARVSADEDGDVILLDVREPREWNYDGRIPGATWIPMNDLPARAPDELPRDASIIVYCAHGVRSHSVARWLVKSGYQDVADINGGLARWMSAGLPVEG